MARTYRECPYDGRIRDKKNWSKPNKLFKRLKARSRRAKIKDALKHERYDALPIFPKTDEWDWN